MAFSPHTSGVPLCLCARTQGGAPLCPGLPRQYPCGVMSLLNVTIHPPRRLVRRGTSKNCSAGPVR